MIGRCCSVECSSSYVMLSLEYFSTMQRIISNVFYKHKLMSCFLYSDIFQRKQYYIVLRTCCHFSFARRLKNCKYLFSKRKSFSFPTLSLDPAKCTKYNQFTVSTCLLPVSCQYSRTISFLNKVNQLPRKNYSGAQT